MHFNRSLSKLMYDHDDDWCHYLDVAVFSINTSIQLTTKYSPFRMMFGREPRFPLEAEKQGQRECFENILNTSEDIEGIMQRFIKKQQNIFVSAELNTQKSQKKQKEQYLKRKGMLQYGFKEGDMVLRRNMRQKTKKGHKNEDRW